MGHKLLTVLLIGASAAVESEIRECFCIGKNPLANAVRAFGSFPAALEYLGCHPLPDAIHISNNTCMAKRDLEDGCAKVAKAIVGRLIDDRGCEPPFLIIDGKDVQPFAGLFTDQMLPISFEPIEQALT